MVEMLAQDIVSTQRAAVALAPELHFPVRAALPPPPQGDRNLPAIRPRYYHWMAGTWFQQESFV